MPRFLSLLALSLAILAPARAQLAIMPLGDSITKGATDSGSGYRDQLYTRLITASLNFTYLGQSTLKASSLLTAADQTRHNGFGTYRVDQIVANFTGALQPGGGADNNRGGYWMTGGSPDGAPVLPDLVLFLGGANDIYQGASAATLLARTKTLLDWFAIHRPSAIVLVGTATPFGSAKTNYATYNQTVLAYNTALPGLVATYAKYRLVDHHALFLNADGSVNESLLYDGVHPTHDAYVAMGDLWADAVLATIPEPSGAALAAALAVSGRAALRRPRRP